MIGRTGAEKVILALSELGTATWEDLKNKTGYSNPVLARHLKKLVELGIITEEIDKKDRRRKIYSLKPKEEVLNIVAQKLTGIILSSMISDKLLKDPEKTLGSVVLLCYSSGEIGKRILPEILEMSFELIKREIPDLVKVYSEAFNKLLESSKKEVETVYKKSGIVKLPKIIEEAIIQLAVITTLEAILQKREEQKSK